jgi:hypothetical protein
LAAIPLAFILPAVCYLKLEDGSFFSSKKIGSFGLAIFGIGATIIGIVSLIVQVNLPPPGGEIVVKALFSFKCISHFSASRVYKS